MQLYIYRLNNIIFQPIKHIIYNSCKPNSCHNPLCFPCLNNWAQIALASVVFVCAKIHCFFLRTFSLQSNQSLTDLGSSKIIILACTPALRISAEFHWSWRKTRESLAAPLQQRWQKGSECNSSWWKVVIKYDGWAYLHLERTTMGPFAAQ